MNQKGNSSSPPAGMAGGGGTAPGAAAVGAGAACAGAPGCSTSARHARMSVYQRPIYSRDSMSK